MTGLCRNDSAGDIETLEYCYSKLQETMSEDKKQRLLEMISGLKKQDKKELKKGKKQNIYSNSYITPAL